MAVRYCLNCTKTAYEEDTYYENKYPYCLGCDHLLYYFGREDGYVSDSKILEIYDAKHPYDPVGDFKGKIVNYGMPSLDINVLECETMLSKNPANETALFCLGLNYKSQNQIDKALMYFETLEAVNPYHVKMNQELGDLYVKIKYFPEAIVCFERLLKGTPHLMDALYNLGVAYFFNQEYDQAKICFKQVKVSDHPERAKQAESILSQLG